MCIRDRCDTDRYRAFRAENRAARQVGVLYCCLLYTSVSFYTRPYDRLEPYDGKLSRTVLRGGAGSNASLLPDIHSEKDILKLTTTLIANTKGDGKAGDEFWTSATRSQTVKSLRTSNGFPLFGELVV